MVNNCFHFLIPVCDSEKYEIIPKWILIKSSCENGVQDKKDIIPNEFITVMGVHFQINLQRFLKDWYFCQKTLFKYNFTF